MSSYVLFRQSMTGFTTVTTPKNRLLGVREGDREYVPSSHNRFEWGLYTAGTVRLAKALLCDRLKCKPAELPVDAERFARDVLMGLPFFGCDLSYDTIDDWVNRQARRSKVSPVKGKTPKLRGLT